MFLRKKRKKYNSGFTLIEALTLLFIFSVITITFYNVIAVGSRYISSARNRLGAISAANERMEIIRNLKYEDIGTDGGSISGGIQQDENVTENASHYNIYTTVEYSDDAFDGLYPTDAAPNDYKKVTVKVSWNSGKESVSLVSRFAPSGLEVANPGDGFLRINVFSDQPGGTGIPNSSVHVVNSETGLDTVVYTDSTGTVILMGDRIRDSIQKYRISLTKSGYEDVTTMMPYPGTPYNPVDTDASVITGSMNVANIVQNQPATLKIATVDNLDNPIANINFHIIGGRILGNTVVTEDDPISLSVYNLDTDSTTNSSGEKNFGLVSPGQYNFTLDPSVTDYELIDTDPISPTALYSNQEMTLKANLANKNTTALLLRLVSSVDSVTPVEGAQIELSNATGYNETETSSATGTVFFPNSSDPLLPGTYDLKIIISGFSEYNSQITIDQDVLKKEIIILNSL